MRNSDRRHRLNPQVRAWLRSPDPAGPVSAVQRAPEAPDWQGWLLRRMARGQILDVGGVMVDVAVLEQRFACVPERCAPGNRERGRVSCCADVELSLSGAERGRLGRARAELGGWLRRREPRLGALEGRFWLDESGRSLCRPGGRCVFSQIDGRGRIRCHLHAFARTRGLSPKTVQPISCGLFPLIVVDVGGRRELLTVVGSATWRLVSAYPPKRYPCLDDDRLPPLVQSMRGELDWLFGTGFARALESRRRRELRRP